MDMQSELTYKTSRQFCFRRGVINSTKERENLKLSNIYNTQKALQIIGTNLLSQQQHSVTSLYLLFYGVFSFFRACKFTKT